MQPLRRGALWLALLLGACGGSSEVVAPAPTAAPVATTTTAAAPTTVAPPSTSTTTTLPPGIEQRPVAAPGPPILLRFDDVVATDVLTAVEETLPIAREDLGEAGSLVVHVYGTADSFVAAHDFRSQQSARQDVDAGLIASANQGSMWIYGPRFSERDRLTRRLIVVHEYFHTVQLSLSSGRSTRGPLWLREGTARYFEFRVGADHGYTDFNRRRTAEIRASRELDSLQSYETRGGATFRGDSGEAYTMGFLAADYLEKIKGIDVLKRGLWVALRSASDWGSAFATVMGVTAEQFYADFEAYRLTL